MLRLTALGCLGMVLLVLPVAAPSACAGERVLVELKNGRTLEAEVDARTNARRLWLRFTSGYTEVLRPLAWSQIARAVVGQENMDAVAFRAHAMKLRSFHKGSGDRKAIDSPWALLKLGTQRNASTARQKYVP